MRKTLLLTLLSAGALIAFTAVPTGVSARQKAVGQQQSAPRAAVPDATKERETGAAQPVGEPAPAERTTKQYRGSEMKPP